MIFKKGAIEHRGELVEIGDGLGMVANIVGQPKLTGLGEGKAVALFYLDGGGSTIAVGEKGDILIPYPCIITAAYLLANAVGNLVIDLWKDTYANYPPTDADSITAAAPPTLASARKSLNSTLTGWTTTIVANDIIAVNVDSVTVISRATLALLLTKT